MNVGVFAGGMVFVVLGLMELVWGFHVVSVQEQNLVMLTSPGSAIVTGLSAGLSGNNSTITQLQDQINTANYYKTQGMYFEFGGIAFIGIGITIVVVGGVSKKKVTQGRELAGG